MSLSVSVTLANGLQATRLELFGVYPTFDPSNPLCQGFVDGVRQAKPGNEFYDSTRSVMTLDDAGLYAALKERRYQLLVYLSGNNVVGHIALQVKKNGPHVFEVFVHKDLRNQGHSKAICEDVVRWAAAQRYTLLRISQGKLAAILQHLRERGSELQIVDVTDDGFITINPFT